VSETVLTETVLIGALTDMLLKRIDTRRLSDWN
jgi:hypothetical protein